MTHSSNVPLRIALTADPELPVPPRLYGGIERVIAVLADQLTAWGHEVSLFAHADSKVNCDLVPYPGRRSGSWYDTLRNTAVIAREVRRRGIQIVHSFGRLAYLLPLLPLRLPKLMTYQREITPRSVSWGRRIAGDCLQFSAISRQMVRNFKDPASWHIVPNMVSLRSYDYAAEVAADAPLVFLGRIEEIKGPHLAIEIARLSGRRLVIAGNVSEGAAHRRFFDQRIAPALDDHQVRYIGPVDDAGKNRLLGSAAALLMPVLWEEPFGIVMIEALACGTPVLGLRRGAVPEVIDHGVTGYVCDEVVDLAAAVARLPMIRREACRESARCRFGEEAVTRQYLQIYRQMQP